MRASVSSDSHQSPTNKQFTIDYFSDIAARLTKSQQLTLLSAGALVTIIAPIMALVMTTRTSAEPNGHIDVSSMVNKTPSVGAGQEVPAADNITADGGGSSVNVNYQSSSHTSSDPSQNQSSASLTVNGQKVPVSQSGNVHKSIHSSNDNSTVNINIDSQSSSSGDSAGSQ